jgi:F0F1-type ATP synthase assembly protein I
MSQQQKPNQQKFDAANAFTASIATIGGSVGCSTLIIILAALFIGLWLDKVFDTKPMFTILLMLGSIPVSIVIMFMIVRSTTARLLPDSKTETNKSGEKNQEEENDSGTTS